MDKMRMLPFIAAVMCIIAVVLIELGSGVLLKNSLNTAGNAKARLNELLPPDDGNPNSPLTAIRSAMENSSSDSLDRASSESIPGYGIPYMASLDCVLMFSMLLAWSSISFPKLWHGRLQGCVSCLWSLSGVLAAVLMIMVAFGLAILMISLLIAVPFGTIAYLAIYGSFDTSSAAFVLSMLLTLKIAFFILMVIAHQSYLTNGRFLLMMFSSLIANILLSLLHGLPPGFLVSITDMIGAIVIGLCGCCWMAMTLVGSVMAIIKAIKNLAI